MKHYKQIKFALEQNVRHLVINIDEFLREYWGQDSYLVHSSLAYSLRNTAIFESFITDYGDGFRFVAFQNLRDFDFLKANHYTKTLEGIEIFAFAVRTTEIEITFYNSFDDAVRERQFLKIASNVEAALLVPYQPIRIRANGTNSQILMCKHRRGYGKIGFHFIPCNDLYDFKQGSIFVHQTDFDYLYPFIIQNFPQEWNDMETFDHTSSNHIRKEDWILIVNNMKNYKTNDNRLTAFYTYLIDWIEKQLKTNTYICLYGNL